MTTNKESMTRKELYKIVNEKAHKHRFKEWLEEQMDKPEFNTHPYHGQVTEVGKDPNGIDQHAPGAKLDEGKDRMELLPLEALREIAGLMTFGADKYTDNGWRHVENGIDRYKGALLRHLQGEEVRVFDDETGFMEATAVACNALFRLQMIIDRRKDEGLPLREEK